jgi:hypothetical protein
MRSKGLAVYGRLSLVRMLCAAVLIVAATTTGAHFLLNLNVRVLHVEHLSDGLRIYMRTPMPYLVADKLGEAVGDQLPDPAPFTTNARENDQVVHFVDPAQLRDDPIGLGTIAEEGLVVSSQGDRLRGQIETVRLHRVGKEPGFATLAEAKIALNEGAGQPAFSEQLYVGDAIVDIMVRYSTGAQVRSYALSSTLDPGLPGQETTANLILDYGPGNPKVFRSRGLMQDPVQVTQSAFKAIGTFIWEGVRHILEGIDHVLFVVCLVIGAAQLHNLLWRVTGFTIGHSVTLALGFFGFVPTGAWFVPAVETGIALSIIYAAVIALRPAAAAEGTNKRVVAVTMLIGLLHGLGFSFVLQEILQVTSPNIWQSLLAFNVGVELGQLAIVLAVWPVMWLLRRGNVRLWKIARAVLAIACLVIATVWTYERLGQVVSVFA